MRQSLQFEAIRMSVQGRDLQPELGTTLDYDLDGRADVLLHDVTGTKNNHLVLRAKPEGTFEEIDTQIPRPFPIGAIPEGLRGSAGAVHLASVDHDAVADLIQCSDHGRVAVSWTSRSIPLAGGHAELLALFRWAW